MSTTDLVKSEAQQLDAYIRNAECLADANLLPPAYRKNPANILLAIQTGAPLGFTAMQSISGIHIISGKPTMSADMMAAAVRRAGHKLRIEADDTQATAILIRSDDPDFEFKSVWTMERARRAGLMSNPSWRKYPAAMLKSRAITEVARQGANDALYGVIYSPEELGETVNEAGDVITGHVQVETTQPTPPAPEPEPEPASEGELVITSEQHELIDRYAVTLNLDRETVLATSAWVENVKQNERAWDWDSMPASTADKLIAYLRERWVAKYPEAQQEQPDTAFIDAEVVEDEQ
ncbi:MAG: hypothetical protein KIC38_03770 [Actinomycetaceae bacterium]|nr:hypothetical protein [Actinomycetaceae bacterium]